MKPDTSEAHALRTYFKQADLGNWAASADAFAVDARFVFQMANGDRIVHESRAELLASLRTGPSGYQHHIRREDSDGRLELIDGYAPGGDQPDVRFVATAALDDDGRIVQFLGLAVEAD